MNGCSSVSPIENSLARLGLTFFYYSKHLKYSKRDRVPIINNGKQ
ncbi:MAG: hypothetical protein ACTHKK_00490 [Candidatus Nitrosocosmicus sp.]